MPNLVRWDHPGGLNAYRPDGTGHFGQRGGRATWTLDELRRQVDLVVIHYDAVGDSRGCFAVLQQRGLSCHFLIDTDGTIYQTLDLRERAWHATIVNDRSIGIEIAHRGAFAAKPGERYPGEIVGVVHDQWLRQSPFTEVQYDALAGLLAALNQTFPRVILDYPRTPDGAVAPRKLTEKQLSHFRGIIAHYHVQANKIDPGPAFDWQRVIAEARTAGAARR